MRPRVGGGDWGIRWRAALAALPLALAGCAFTDAPAPLLERSDSAGVEVIRLTAPPADTLRLGSPEVRIGSTGLEGSEREIFQLLTDLALLPEGQVAVVDNRGARVALFDSTGAWVRDFGRSGEGPGEYTAPLALSARADTLFVWDPLQRRMSRFTAAGVFVGSDPLPHWSGGHRFAAVDDGWLLETEWGQLMDPAPAAGAVVRTGRDGTARDTVLGPYRVPEVGWVVTGEDGTGHMKNPPAFEVGSPWAVDPEGGIARLDPGSARVELRSLSAGALELVVALPYAAAPPTPKERDAFFSAIQDLYGLPDEVMARERESTEFAALRPPVAGLVLDGGSRLWVGRHDPAARRIRYVGSGWDVIDVDEGTAWHVLFPDGFELRAVQGSRAFGFMTLESGVQVVDIFRVEATP